MHIIIIYLKKFFLLNPPNKSQTLSGLKLYYNLKTMETYTETHLDQWATPVEKADTQ